MRSFPGYQRTWSVAGTRLIYTALTHNSTVIFNTTEIGGSFTVDSDGKYRFVATSKFGTDMKEFSAIISGKI